MTVSKCCGAELVFKSYDPKNEPYPTICTACGKPYEMVKYTDRDKSINWDASETELRAIKGVGNE